MNESHDPLKSLFEEAAASGRARASCPPVGEISARGRRVRRRRLAVLAAGACLVVGAGGATLASLLPGPSEPVVPATSPSVSGPAPADTTAPLPATTSPSSAPATTMGSPATATTTTPPGTP
ncbi:MULTISPECIES: hypothetical protein [unclassified Streptomyces]|uniref:hypothetical protein n=1 Tax=unclassified Streptomyces TaxID=2593676 RepID=UPI0036FA8817